MNVILLGFLSAAVLDTGVSAGYHSEIGIPLGSRIKEAEDKLFARRTNEKNAKIVGGQVVSHNGHPYLAGLLIRVNNYLNNLSICGSSLITANRLVTAGHCVVNDENELVAGIEVVLGSQYLYYGGLRILASDVNVYPEYNSWIPGVKNDIAVVYLPEPVEFSDNIQSIALARPSGQPDQFVWKTAVAAGYGRTSDSQKLVPEDSEVRQVWLQVIPEHICHSFYRNNAPLGTIVCTSGSGGVGTCHGDSGGSLVVIENGWKILVGITSFGDIVGCQYGSPVAFTRVSSFIDFIVFKCSFLFQ